jgi:hypothetical protein
MALIQKDENDDLKILAAKSNPIMFYATDAAAEDAYTNGEIPEGTIVITEEEAESDQWVDFTPYSTSGLTDISMKHREEGGLVHYMGKARFTAAPAAVLSASLTLKNDNTMKIFRCISQCTSANGSGWPLSIGDIQGTNVISFTVVDASRAGSMQAWITFDIWATA